MDKLRVIDFFCGCGGFSKGFEEEGFSVLGVDCWPVCLKSHGGNTLKYDIGKLTKPKLPSEWQRPTVVIGSPPCQSFSTANRHSKIKDDTLIKHFMRLIHSLRPDYWVWENVVGSTSVRRGFILDAQNFGAPQRRKRNFVANFDIHPDIMKQYYSDRKNTVRRAFRHRELKGSGLLDGYNSTVYSLDDVSPTLRRIPLKWYDDRYGKPGELDLPKPLRFTGFDMLTVEEHQMLMGFSPRKKIYGNKGEQMIQVGNAVSPAVSRAIAKRVKYLLKQDESLILYRSA